MNITRVTAAVLKKGDRYLIAQRKKGAHLEFMWEFPGGKIEVGESPEECLARELKEEFEIEVSIGSFIHESLFDYGHKQISLLGYYADHLSGEVVLNDHQDIAWVSIDEFDLYELAPADIPIVDKLRKKHCIL